MPPAEFKNTTLARLGSADRFFRTTSFKLALAYVIIVGLGFTLALGHVGDNVRALINEQITQTLDVELKGLTDQYEEGGLTQLVNVVQRRAQAPGASIYLVAAPNGIGIAGNVLELPADVLSQTAPMEIAYERPGEANVRRRALARAYVLPDGFRLLVGQDLEDRERLGRILSAALMGSLPWLLAIGAFGGFIVARRLLQRVDAMSAKATTLLQEDLTGRLPLSGAGDEIDRLAQNLNAMLDRIAKLVEGIRQVSDNIAHDLRTPLTRLRNNAEQALMADRGDSADGDSASRQASLKQALEHVIEEADGLIRIFNALLLIARAETHTSSEGFTELDGAALAADMVELYEPSAEERGVHLKVAARGAEKFRGHRELIGQALANLIDNALKYGEPPLPGQFGEVTVGAAGDARAVEIFVADRGPGIPAADRERVLERFVRLEASRSRPGSGLGLSLAAAVARLHGGQLRVENNEPGLRVTLRLPREAAS
ncbi:two-component sensor histidine kinase [Rhodoblastus sphagnicola]|uniref:histidine kinase n=1 Tax=Rhodoblastus sphagnicola TaxID=333368 RepID=A0A2S6MZ40_9HYPH|nr:ATP-binding protein [Rhodoblastus sphagnicola]MBB4198660.1 signal transduction histidine kinase [Rhodoblastus sphagnicola]PPQ27631.1 two-component sensor histidine kinase [Rhodoblastus sphagnicola]